MCEHTDHIQVHHKNRNKRRIKHQRASGLTRSIGPLAAQSLPNIVVYSNVQNCRLFRGMKENICINHLSLKEGVGGRGRGCFVVIKAKGTETCRVKDVWKCCSSSCTSIFISYSLEIPYYATVSPDRAFWLDKSCSVSADIDCDSSGTFNIMYHSA